MAETQESGIFIAHHLVSKVPFSISIFFDFIFMYLRKTETCRNRVPIHCFTLTPTANWVELGPGPEGQSSVWVFHRDDRDPADGAITSASPVINRKQESGQELPSTVCCGHNALPACLIID